MQYTIEHLARAAGKNTRVWKLLLSWLMNHWQSGEETTLHTADYFQLWSPVQREEFPY